MLAAVMLATTKIWQCLCFTAVLSLAAPGCSPGGPELLIRGDQLLQAGKAPEAVVVLEKAVSRLPTDSRVWNHLGLGYHAAGRFAEARKAYSRALELNRNLIVTHFNLGALEFEQRNWRETESELRTFLQWNPNSGEAWSKLGQAQFQSGQPESAERSLQNAVRLQPQDADAWNILGLVQVQRRQYREAYKSFAAAQKASPGHPASLLNLGITAQQQLGDRRAALQHYLAYVELNPAPANSGAVRDLVAQLERQLGVSPRAVSRAPPVTLTTNSPLPFTRPSSSTKPLAMTNRAPGGQLASRVPPVALSGTNRWPGPTLAGPGPRADAPAMPSATPGVVTNPLPSLAGVPRLSETKPVGVPAAVAPPVVSAPVLPALVVQSEMPTVVILEKEIALQPARDPVPLPLPANPPPNLPPKNPTPVVSTPVIPAVPAVPAATEPDTRPPGEDVSPTSLDPSITAFSEIGDPPAPKKSVWHRMNPVRWFRKDESPVNSQPAQPAELAAPAEGGGAVKKRLAILNPAHWFKNSPSPKKLTPLEPLPPDVAEPIATGAVTVAPAAKAPVPPPPKPVFARYTRQLSARPAAGNRRAAEEQFNLGVMAHERRDLSTAIARYQRATQYDPSYHDAQYNLAVAALVAGDLPLSLLAGEYAVATTDRPEESRWNLALALKRAKYPADAAEELNRLTASAPGDVRAELMLASIYARELKEVTQARQHYEKVLALNPNHPESSAIRNWLQLNPGP